jgi:hypothetical protein
VATDPRSNASEATSVTPMRVTIAPPLEVADDPHSL